MFLMLGPNTATGHTSTLLYIEPEVQHAITCMQAVRTGGHRWIDVRAEVLGAHNRALQARLGGLGMEPVPQLVPHRTATAASSRCSPASRLHRDDYVASP
jgi:hypothetical protein